MNTTVLIERGGASFGAYVLDLPGCVAALETREEVLELIEAAIVGSSKARANPTVRARTDFEQRVNCGGLN